MTPSPIVTTLGELFNSQQSECSSSQVSSDSFPSPTVMSLKNILEKKTVEINCEHNFEFICSKLGELNTGQKNQILSIVLPQVSKSDLQQQSEEQLLHLSKVFGEVCRDKLKKEADSFRMKRSRDDSDISSVEILSKKLKIEILHQFFESCTGKSGRVHSKNQEKVASYQATFYESLLKGVNIHTLGPFSLMKLNQVKLRVQSKAVFEGQLGGSYTFHQNNSPTEEPLEMTYKGPLISDNAQLGAGKFQHHAFGKLDRSTPVVVCTHNIRAEAVDDYNDNEIFEDEKMVPSNHQFHSLFRPVQPEFFKVVEERIGRDKENGLKAANTIQQKWMEDIIEDRKKGGGVTSFTKVSQHLDFGDACRRIVCQNCHYKYRYNKDSRNICAGCENNPTHYAESDLGPYRCYNFPEKGPNTVEIREQEPLGLNPSGRKNLMQLHSELRKYWPPEIQSFPFYGDGLPAVSFERIKSDSVDCTTHNVNIPIKDTKLLAQHSTEQCVLDWPLKDLYVLCGMSHEEIGKFSKYLIAFLTMPTIFKKYLIQK